MAMSYYKTFKVPCWVILSNTKKNEAILEWFKEAEARIVEWPTTGFADAVESFKNKGWRHVWDSNPVTIPPQLLTMAVDQYVKEKLNPFSLFSFNAVHRLNRTVTTKDVYDNAFNTVLADQTPIVLSQAFQVAEICHDENKAKRPQLWVTEEPCEKSVISKISDNVITIGNGAGYDINISKVKDEDLSGFLAKKVVELFKKNS